MYTQNYSTMTTLRKHEVLGQKRQRPVMAPPVCAWSPNATSASGFCQMSNDPDDMDKQARCVALNGECVPNTHKLVPFELVHAFFQSRLLRYAFIDAADFAQLKAVIDGTAQNAQTHGYAKLSVGDPRKNRAVQWQALYENMDLEMRARQNEYELPAYADPTGEGPTFTLNDKGQRAKSMYDEMRARRSASFAPPY